MPRALEGPGRPRALQRVAFAALERLRSLGAPSQRESPWQLSLSSSRPDIRRLGTGRPGGPHIQQRDWLNLLAAFAAAKQHGCEASLVAASPGVDAAAVAPEYEEVRQRGAARVLEMDREGVLREQPDTAPPACSLPLLPPTLFPHRVAAVLETRFGAELRTLDQRIMADVPAAKRGEHASKTYHMFVAAADAVRDAPPGDSFFALGQFRSAEKARAYLHSSYATGIYDLGHLRR